MSNAAAPLLAFNFGTMEMMIVLAIGLLLFGSRLPSVGRNIGKSITEFKKGMKDAGDELSKDDAAPNSGAGQRPQISDYEMQERATQEAMRRIKAEQVNGKS